MHGIARNRRCDWLDDGGQRRLGRDVVERLLAARVQATTGGLLLALLGLLIAGHIWAAVVVLMLTLARYGYYLYFLRGGRHGEKEHNE